MTYINKKLSSKNYENIKNEVKITFHKNVCCKKFKYFSI